MSNNLISTIGLCVDALGAGLLGFDLIRFQHRVRKEAGDQRDLLASISEEYGGVVAWAKEIKRNTRWMPGHTFQEYHAEDEVSYNARNIAERASELGDCVDALGEHLAKVTLYLGEAAEGEAATSAVSLHYSVIGVVLIGFGFLLQAAGTNL
jgi:hypothetical protein